jgi:GTP-binding protein HflX
VRTVLHEIGASGIPEVVALNKVDRVSEHERARALARIDGPAVAISARTGEGLDELMVSIESALPRFPIEVLLLVPYGREDVTALLHRDAEVLSEDAREDGTLVRARVGERELSAVQPFRLEQGARADAG